MGTFACKAIGGGSCLTIGVQVSGTDAGVCHVVVTVADASSYTADVTFQQEPASECCPAGLSPPVMVSIDDSASGCAYYGNAAADASLEAGADASAAKDGSMEGGDTGATSDASMAATDAGAGADVTSASDAAGDD